MWKSILILLCLCGYCYAGPVIIKRNIPIMREDQPSISEPDASAEVNNEKSEHEMPIPSTLTLPSNATSIRADIMDGFKCDDRPYGYYADVENDCQIFHVCLPVTYADGKENTFRWSFICPEETIFSQDSFTCMRPEDMSIDCSDSQNYYDLNRNFGMTEEEVNKETIQNNLTPVPNKVHDEALSVFSDKTAQSDVVLAHSAPAPTIVKPYKPKRTQKPISSKPIHSIKTKPINLLPLRKISQIQTISDKTQPISDNTQNHLDSFSHNRRRPIQSQSNHEVLVESHIEQIVPVVEQFNNNRRRPVQSNLELLVESQNEKIAPVVKVSEQKLSTLKSDHKKGTQSTYTQNLGKLKLPNTNIENSETTKLIHKSPELVPTLTIESLPDDENLKKTQSTSAQNLGKLELPTTNTENSDSTNLDHKSPELIPTLTVETLPDNENLKKTQSVSAQNLGKFELSTANTENSETTKLDHKLAELIPLLTVETLPDDDNLKKTLYYEANVATETKTSTTANTQKLAEKTPLLSEVIEETQADSKETVPNDIVDDKTVEASENSDLFVNAPSPSIFEEHSEEIGLISTADAEDLPLKETSSVTIQEEEKEKPLDTNVDVGEDVVKNTPVLSSVPESEKIESDVVEDFSQVEQGIEKETSDNVAPSQEDKEITQSSHEKVEVDSEQEDKDTIKYVQNTEIENNPEILLTQTDDNSFKQSMGGFKPVDAEKAAEAEAIITDFLNTLRTTEIAAKPTNEQSVENNDKEELKDSVDNQETLLSTDESKETETEAGVDQTKTTLDESKDTSEFDVKPLKEDDNEEKPASDAKQDQTSNNLLEELKNIVGGVGANANTLSLKTGPIATYPIMNSFPSDMYQIPVKVIEAPVEDTELIDPIPQQNKVEIAKETAAEVEVAPNTAIYTPLSIEDIVDLVKERLDQTPLEDKIKPMHLTLESLKSENSGNPIEIKEQAELEHASTNSEVLSNADVTAAQESEEIIMPIYHRLTESDISSTKTNQIENENSVVSSPIQIESIPAEAATAEKSDVNVETENNESFNADGDNSDSNLLKTKSSRLYRSRSIKNAVKMDPRKRRFLFRSDAH